MTPPASELMLEELYFSQDERKPQTYHRTGTYMEIDMDPEEVFATVTSWVIVIYIVVKGVIYFF